MVQVTLLGTGGPTGAPDPWCTCASCRWAASAGVYRAAAAALVDGVVALERPEPGSAVRWRAELTRVRAVLRSGIRGESGTSPGQRVAVGGWTALAVEAGGSALAWLLGAGPGGGGPRLLWSPGSGALDEHTAAEVGAWGPVELALLGGAPAELAASAAALRRGGALAGGCRVVPVGLDHRWPPGPQRARLLADAGAAAEPDGTVLRLPGPAPAHSPAHSPAPDPSAARRVLVLGGARSGKSEEAERRLAARERVCYVATGEPAETCGDPDWVTRVRAHRARRPAHWTTVETVELDTLLALDDPTPLLIEDGATWLARVLARAPEAQIDRLCRSWAASRRDVVLVSAEVGMGVHPETAVGRRYRDLLGRLNRGLAAGSDEVWFVVAGLAHRLR